MPFGQDRTDPPSTIVFLTSALEASQFWEERIAAFEADNPTIHVKLRYDQVPDDWPGQADVVLGFWPDRWPDFVSPGKALDLTPLIESDSSFDAADYYPGALDLYRQDGHTWAIPIGWSFKAIAYLPALFQEKNIPLLEATHDLAPAAFFPDALAAVSWQEELYGIPVAIKAPVLRFRPALFRALDLETPSASWTMEKVIQAAQKITDGGRGYLGLLPQPEEMDFVLNQLGIPLFTSGTLPRPRFATPEVQTALERLMRLGGKTTAVPLAFEDAVAFVSGGRVAMWFEGTTYFQVNDGETEIVPIRLRSDVRFPLQTTALGIAKNAEHVQECWAWITYLLHQGVHPSAGLSALRNQATLESAQPGPQQMHYAAALKTLQEMKTAQITDGPTTDWAVWWFTQAMREIAKGTEPMLALQTAQNEAEAFIACLGPSGENDLAAPPNVRARWTRPIRWRRCNRSGAPG